MGGVVRKVRCSYSPLTITQVERLANIVQHEPCVLQDLDIAWCRKKRDGDDNQHIPAANGWRLDNLLVPLTQTIACRRILRLNVACLGFVGPVPAALGQCTLLRHLGMALNFFEGPLPAWLPDMPFLNALDMNDNWLSGSVDIISRCTRLKNLSLPDNCLEGELPQSCVKVLGNMDSFSLGTRRKLLDQSTQRVQHREQAQARDGFHNSRLCVTMEMKLEICALWTSAGKEALNMDDEQIWPQLWQEEQ